MDMVIDGREEGGRGIRPCLEDKTLHLSCDGALA